jgi:hypothetical protein
MSIQICFYPGFSISLTFVCVCLVQLLFIELITTKKRLVFSGLFVISKIVFYWRIIYLPIKIMNEG